MTAPPRAAYHPSRLARLKKPGERPRVTAEGLYALKDSHAERTVAVRATHHWRVILRCAFEGRVRLAG